jgi:hypothetical protein
LANAASTSSSLMRADGSPRSLRFCSSVPSPIIPGWLIRGFLSVRPEVVSWSYEILRQRGTSTSEGYPDVRAHRKGTGIWMKIPLGRPRADHVIEYTRWSELPVDTKPSGAEPERRVGRNRNPTPRRVLDLICFLRVVRLRCVGGVDFGARCRRRARLHDRRLTPRLRASVREGGEQRRGGRHRDSEVSLHQISCAACGAPRPVAALHSPGWVRPWSSRRSTSSPS